MAYIKNEYPDLVICDTELQNMDGVELSSRLKTSCETSIIPIILYSSHIDINQHNRRKTSLADTFLQQPFSVTDLKLEMSILIKNTRFLRKSFLQRLFGEEFLETKASEILQDGKHPLISKVTKIILENLNNEKLTIDSIAKELGISRTSLYNKWTQLTGEALNKFILKIRMEKAHEMLKSGKYRVNEVPEKIGMKDMDNFREKYKKYFGKTPVDTIKNV
jgi:YesN/AraC family two-component response regulator